MQLELRTVLAKLAKRRPVFHSEADFQHSLAWEVQLAYPDAQIRLEVPILGLEKRAAFDIQVLLGGKTAAIEVKYIKERLEFVHKGEAFALPPTVARDIDRYDICKDITRIEHLVELEHAEEGFVVVLSNDSALWTGPTRRPSIDEQFKIHHGRCLEGVLRWSADAGPGTTKNREDPLTLRRTYTAAWFDYSSVNGSRGGQFKYLMLHVAGKRADHELPQHVGVAN